MNTYKNLLIIGGAGNLGKAIVANFKESWKIVNIDLKPNTEANLNILLNTKKNIEEDLPTILTDLEKFSQKYDSIMCVAGGFMMGSIKDKTIFPQHKTMQQAHVIPSILAGHLASKYLSSTGLLLLTGAAKPFRQPCPESLAYALAKTSVHAIAMNLAEREDVPKESTVVTILPEMIDTPENREAMPTADVSTWLAPDHIAGLLRSWADGSNRPKNGSFAILKTVNGSVVPEFV